MACLSDDHSHELREVRAWFGSNFIWTGCWIFIAGLSGKGILLDLNTYYVYGEKGRNTCECVTPQRENEVLFCYGCIVLSSWFIILVNRDAIPAFRAYPSYLCGCAFGFSPMEFVPDPMAKIRD